MSKKINNIKNWMLVLTFFSLWLTAYFGKNIEELLAFLLIFSFGILHGANDIYILNSMKLKDKRNLHQINILITYVIFVISGALLFYFLPIFGLISFILFSAYHFGEQHWHQRWPTNKNVFAVFLYLAYGCVILGMLFSFHSQEVSEIIYKMSGFTVPDDFFNWMLISSSVVFFISIFMVFGKRTFKVLIFEVFLLAVFAVVFNSAELIWAFAIYFILWHTIPSLWEQLKYLYGSINKESGLLFLKSSSLYWVLALVSLAAAFLWMENSEENFLPLFFAFLAAITFPHVLVMGKLYRSKK